MSKDKLQKAVKEMWGNRLNRFGSEGALYIELLNAILEGNKSGEKRAREELNNPVLKDEPDEGGSEEPECCGEICCPAEKHKPHCYRASKEEYCDCYPTGVPQSEKITKDCPKHRPKQEKCTCVECSCGGIFVNSCPQHGAGKKKTPPIKKKPSERIREMVEKDWDKFQEENYGKKERTPMGEFKEMGPEWKIPRVLDFLDEELG